MKSNGAKPYLKIGDVARMVGVSPSVIRSWESLGLTQPHRTESKYRLYTADDVKLLKRARFLRRVRGLNAPAIVELLKREGLVRSSPNGAAAAIGARLRQLRIRRGLSLAPVAKAAGISVGFLSAIERSQMSASIGWLLDPRTHQVATDWRLGALTRPTPWLSLGGVAEHLFQSDFQSRRLGRAYGWSCWRGATR